MRCIAALASSLSRRSSTVFCAVLLHIFRKFSVVMVSSYHVIGKMLAHSGIRPSKLDCYTYSRTYLIALKSRSGILFLSTPSKTKKRMSPTRFSGQKTFLIGSDTSDNRCRRVSSVHHGNRLRRFLRGLAQGCGPHF